MSRVFDEAVYGVIAGLNRKREQQIINALSLAGHSFDNRAELERFVVDHCQLCTYVNSDLKVLKVDGRPILQWDDQLRVEYDGDDLKFTFGDTHGCT